jgi:hypothetical protein
MSQAQNISGSPSMPDLTATFTKGAETFIAAQKVWTDTMESTHRDLVTLFDAEAKLGTEFVSRLREAKTVPEVASACQEWMFGRIELNSKEWHKAVEHGQKLVNACARINGSERVRST